MKKYTARFDVVCYDDSRHEQYERSGFVSCDDFTDAMSEIERYYGEEIISIQLELLDLSLVEMTKDMADEVVKMNCF